MSNPGEGRGRRLKGRSVRLSRPSREESAKGADKGREQQLGLFLGGVDY